MARMEQDVFDELAKICISPGYAHAIAHLCFRDNAIGYSEEMTAQDMQSMFSMERLIRTEISTLIGLMVKAPIDYVLPDPQTLQHYLDRTDALLSEMHSAMSQAFFGDGFDVQKLGGESGNPFQRGAVLRESIFYASESAYSFQYRDLSPRKYGGDDVWLQKNKGFTIDVARRIVQSVGTLQNDKLLATLVALRLTPQHEWTLLPGYAFTTNEVAECAGVDIAIVERVLAAFTFTGGEANADFRALHDFNNTNALPLLRTGEGEFLLFQTYSLVEALYEAPFYWMGADQEYVATAMRNRGRFTEEFAKERLERVFGKSHVFANVDIFETKGKKLGEIDVLVVFANRAIVLQAKSKRLTLEARKGNDRQIKDDFKKSVQDSYDQGYLCASLLGDARNKLVDGSSNEIVIPRNFKEVYILCVVSDHYPALSFQARQFLTSQKSDAIQPPFILDVFALDAITEMLQSPLQFLSYVNRRTLYADRLLASHELTILSYHLKQNLWLDDDHDMVMLSDDISADLDVAMAVRRDVVPGKRTPDGILTRFVGTTLWRLLEDIEAKADSATIDLGFMLLTLNEDTFNGANQGLSEIGARARRDGKTHDITIGLGVGGTGFTIHCNEDPIHMAASSLQRHCERRKYTEKASSWFGVCLRPNDMRMQFGLSLESPWKPDPEMDELTKGLAKPSAIPDALRVLRNQIKVKRNEPCPCGSGRKYKKCCLS